MRYCFYPFLCAGLALAQSSTTEYTVDLSGHRVASAEFVSKDGDKAELIQSINGRKVPVERTEVKVLTEQPGHKVTETIVRRYDADGRLSATERTVSDETKNASGSTIQATVYRSDANGRLQESERRTIESQTQGATTTADVTIARAGLSGSFETAEKRKIVTVVDGNTTRESESVARHAQGSRGIGDARQSRRLADLEDE